jgi:hypothetical protein
VQSAVHIHRAFAHLFEQSPKLLFVHTARITARRGRRPQDWSPAPRNQKMNFMPSCRMRGLCAPPARKKPLLA